MPAKLLSRTGVGPISHISVMVEPSTRRMQMEAKAHRRSSEMGTLMPGMSGAGLVCWVEISASSALNKVDRQGDEGIYCLLTQQNGVTWRQYLGRWMTDMDRSGGDG